MTCSMIKTYRYKLECRDCSGIFNRLTFERERENTISKFTCEACMRKRIKVKQGTSVSEKRCELCVHADKNNPKGNWCWIGCKMGHVGDDDDPEGIGLVHIYQRCSDFERK